jgi:hypothetical protein
MRKINRKLKYSQVVLVPVISSPKEATMVLAPVFNRT